MKKSLSLAVRCSTLRIFIARTDLKKKKGNKKKETRKTCETPCDVRRAAERERKLQLITF